MNKKTVHIISHSHWDREWYMPFERHRVALVKLMDNLLELLEKDPEFKSFHMDGHILMIEDYLTIRPEMKQKVVQYAQQGRLIIGPWYILQDAFLTSSEANVRNLQYGLKESEQYGEACPIGYFPDTFGNMGQAPQLLNQAGIKTAVFGRGVKPTGFNNTVADSNRYQSNYSEMIWQSPDGSQVTGILFANWYHNGMEIPTDEEEAKRYWQERLEAVERYASTPHLLMMNGCDHQPVQKDLTKAIETARKLYPDIEFVHSNFTDYARSIQEALPNDVAVMKGELRSQYTDGWTTLVNTASSRVYIKQANQLGQTLLEKVAEPLAAFAQMKGKSYPHHWFDYAWKTLMENHPHDSICGCSVDEVHREMMPRFEKSKAVAEEIISESIAALNQNISTTDFSSYGDAVPFVVYNTSGWARTATVEVEIEIDRRLLYEPSPVQLAEELDQVSIEGYLVDDEGNPIECVVKDLGVSFGYDLPEDAFRQPYLKRVIKVSFSAEHIPCLGYRTYAWIRSKEDQAIIDSDSSSIITSDNEMENEYLKVSIHEDGTLSVLDKQSGRLYEDLCAYEDAGDIGSEYVFKQPNGEKTRTTNGLKANIKVVENTSFLASFEIVHEWLVPKCADETLDREILTITPVWERQAQRVDELVPIQIKTVVTLEKGDKSVRVKTTINNQAKDHRIRALFPTDLAADCHYADSIFEIAERSNVPSDEWTNPSYCHHQQAFVSLHQKDAGLTIANKGLNEYEVLRDGRNTIAITLLRSVGNMGDWGVFPTPEAQCLGEYTLEYCIIPFSGEEERFASYDAAYQFQIPVIVGHTDVHEGTLPAVHSFIEWDGEGLALSSVKVEEKHGDLVVRWFNMDQTHRMLTANGAIETWRKSDILERRGTELMNEGQNEIKLRVEPDEIITVTGEIK